MTEYHKVKRTGSVLLLEGPEGYLLVKVLKKANYRADIMDDFDAYVRVEEVVRDS